MQKEKLKKLNYNLVVYLLITFFFLFLSLKYYKFIFVLADSLLNFIETFVNFICDFFNINYRLKITIFDNLELTKENIFLPKDFEIFKLKVKMYFYRLINLETLKIYFVGFTRLLLKILKYSLLIIPIIVIIYLVFIRRYFKPLKDEEDVDKKLENIIDNIEKDLKVFNNYDYKNDSIYLQKYKKIEKPILKIINKINSFYNYVFKSKLRRRIWVVIWFFYFNINAVLIDIIAFYMGFVLTFDLLSVYRIIYDSLSKLTIMFKDVPVLFWVVVGLKLFNKWRIKRAVGFMYNLYFRNKDFVEDLGVSTLITGEMGTGKTQMLTDVVDTKNLIFREKAQELIYYNFLKFPNFPFGDFEKDIKEKIDDHTLYNLSTIKNYIRNCDSKFDENRCKDNVWGYDYETYGLMYYDSLGNQSLFDVLESYACLYFIYTLNCNYLILNYSARTQETLIIEDECFPEADTSPFKDYDENESKFAHIIDFDMLRPGLKVKEDNPNENALDIGIVGITEAGKERGNMISNQGLKKVSIEANPKNDLFELDVKMSRHRATIDYYCFYMLVMDEQRAMSLGADGREICEKVMTILDKSSDKSTLFLFSYESDVYKFLIKKYFDLYYKFRYVRNDNVLLFYLLNNLFGKLFNRYENLKNSFGFEILSLSSQNGKMDSKILKEKYYLIYKKIRNRKYSTDAFSEYFEVKNLNSSIGLNDFDTYKSEKAMFSEWVNQNSYFANDLLKDWGVWKNAIKNKSKK